MEEADKDGGNKRKVEKLMYGGWKRQIEMEKIKEKWRSKFKENGGDKDGGNKDVGRVE